MTRRDPLGHLVLEQLLRERGFAGLVSTDSQLLETYSTDESVFSIAPQVVLQPRNVEDVSIASTLVSAETKRFDSLSLTPRGGGVGVSGGSLTNSVVIDMSTYLTQCGAVEHKKADEVHITCEAGVRWSAMLDKLHAVGFDIPIEIAAKDATTVGGAVANNAAGVAVDGSYQRCSESVVTMQVVLADGAAYDVQPLTYKQFQTLSKKKHEYARILRELYTLLEKNESEIKKNHNNQAIKLTGYNLWDVLPQGSKAFKKGNGVLNPIPLLAGSQGTIGLITAITLRAVPRSDHTTLLAVPVFDLNEMAGQLETAHSLGITSVEAFDGRTFDLALQHPEFFKKIRSGMTYYRTVLAMYTTYHIRYQRVFPELVLLMRVSDSVLKNHPTYELNEKISTKHNLARTVTNPVEEDMFWLLHRSAYALANLRDYRKRPATFLEDMRVPLKNLPRFINAANNLFKEFSVDAVIHGHAGIGHLHFYPLVDFTSKTAPALVEKLSDRFFDLAIKYEGEMCPEYNDGILRTPRLNKLFSKKALNLFTQLEHIFDPNDIFNPGKKVNPRFDVSEVLRTHN